MLKRIQKALFEKPYYVQGKCVWCTDTDLLLYYHAPDQKADGLNEFSFVYLFDIMDQLGI